MKVLPTPEEWERLKVNILEKGTCNYVQHTPVIYEDIKGILIDETVWVNDITRKKEKVYDIPIIAIKDTNLRPRAITKITESINDAQDENKCNFVVNKTWVFNDFYSHINMSSTEELCTIYSQFKTKDSDGNRIPNPVPRYRYAIQYQEICSPITMHHFYKEDAMKVLPRIFKGQLMGQNSGSAFQTVFHVANSYKDYAVLDSRGAFIKPSAPLVQLLTGKPLQSIQDNIYDTAIRIKNYKMTEEEIFVKLKLEKSYIKMAKEEADKIPDCISQHYPVITYEQVQNILDKIPKQEIDVLCAGLGSAGSNILDQLGRSTYFNSYLLVDMDSIEEKNLRNQWYSTYSVRDSKTSASANTLRGMSSTPRTIVTRYSRFQEACLENFKVRYAISGFDTIDTRLEFLEYIEKGELETDYLIDARYDGLSASLFFIDVHKEDEMKIYKANLLADKQAFEELEQEQRKGKCIESAEDFFEWFEHNDYFNAYCGKFRQDFGVTEEERSFNCEINRSPGSCGSEKCRQFLKGIYEKNKERFSNIYRVGEEPNPESTCIRQNFIDIYKYTSCFVFAAIRCLESEEPKPFTHVELTVDPTPKSVIYKK